MLIVPTRPHPRPILTHVIARRQDDADGAYTLSGEVDPATGMWSLERHITQGQQTIVYK